MKNWAHLRVKFFSMYRGCSKTKTNVITLANHNRRRLSNEPITTPGPSAGKRWRQATTGFGLRPPQTRKHWETLLRKHCFLAAQTGKHLLKKQNVSEKSQKHFLFLGSKKCFRNKCFLSAQTGKHLGKQQCFRNNVSSFAGGLYVWLVD